MKLGTLVPKEKPHAEGLAAAMVRLERYLDPRAVIASPLLFFGASMLRKADELQLLSDEDLRSALRPLRLRIRKQSNIDFGTLVRVAPILTEITSRATGMRPYKVQIAGAIALHFNCVVQMQTGEGKSLTAAMAAVLAAWTGKPCHVLTANCYLADRDAAFFKALFNSCELSVDVVTEGLAQSERQRAYSADVVYTTAKEMLGDLLRDEILIGPRPGPARIALQMLQSRSHESVVLRGLGRAIVDEADCLLIDDAVTPLIIAKELDRPGFAAALQKAHYFSLELDPSRDINILAPNQLVELSPFGIERLSRYRSAFPAPWSQPEQARGLVELTLTARFIMQYGRHYLIEDGKIILLDAQTGRRAIGRTLSNGLHQAVELSEGLALTPLTEITGRQSFQRFFRLFPGLAGLTGTATEARGEFWTIYGLPLVRIPTHRKPKRQKLRTVLKSSRKRKFQAVADETEAMARSGRPVLIGTRSIDGAQQAYDLLVSRGFMPRLLTALDEAGEAEIVAMAGVSGTITISTNLAGRGTDIALDPVVADFGGLHVVIAEANDLARTDRQMAGRSGRQGDPGSVRTFLTPEDIVFTTFLSTLERQFLQILSRRPCFLASVAAESALKIAQSRAARRGREMRRRVLESDLKFERSGL